MAQFFKSLTCIVLGYNLGADGDITSAFRQKYFSCTVNSVNWVVKFPLIGFKISSYFFAKYKMSKPKQLRVNHEPIPSLTNKKK